MLHKTHTMSKKNNKKAAIEIRKDGIPLVHGKYAELPVENTCQSYCLVQDKQGARFVFKSKSHCTIVQAGIEHCWSGFDDFADRCTVVECLAYHEKLFGTAEIHKALEDKDSGYLMLKLAVWKGLCMTANQRLEKAVRIDEKTGAPVGRKLANRSYVLAKTDFAAVTIPQAKACLNILKDVVVDENGVLTVKEDDLKKAVVARQDELKTRQDPWRIFQYYRPQLIAAGIVRLI